MNIKKIVIGTLALLTLAIIAFTQFNSNKNNETAITSFEIKAENIEELKNFDWNEINEMFKKNEPEQEISLAVILLNKSKNGDNLKFKVTGKSGNIDILMKNIKKKLEL